MDVPNGDALRGHARARSAQNLSRRSGQRGGG